MDFAMRAQKFLQRQKYGSRGDTARHNLGTLFSTSKIPVRACHVQPLVVLAVGSSFLPLPAASFRSQFACDVPSQRRTYLPQPGEPVFDENDRGGRDRPPTEDLLLAIFVVVHY